MNSILKIESQKITDSDQCILSNLPLPEPYQHYPNQTNIYNYADPNRTCKWLAYSEKFCYVEIGETSFYTESQAMKKCTELGRNKCNAVKSKCQLGVKCFQSFTPIYVFGLSEDQSWSNGPDGDGSFITWLINDCSMWQKWPSHYLYGQSYNDETHTTLAAAQESCYKHGPMCNAVKRKGSKYYLMQSQDIPSKKSGSWADYWVKLASTN